MRRRSGLGPALVDRRRFLAYAAGAAAFAACGTDGDPAKSAGGTAPTSAPLDPHRLDPKQPYWLQGNYAPVTDEVIVDDLTVQGSLPAGLRGTYVRNGSNPATGNSPHWFLGDGMVHGLRLEDGTASWYRNRYVRTPAYEGRREFGDLTAGAPGAENGQSNVSVVRFGDRLLSLGEVGWPYELSPADLDTVGPVPFTGPGLTQGPNFTAHPKIDPDTGELHAFGYGFVAPFLTYYRVAPDGTLLAAEEIEVSGPTMMHDFAITDRDVVFWELPVVFDLESAVAGGEFPFVWRPDYGARLGVLPLGGPAGSIRWVDIPEQMVFHGVNAFRDGDEIVVDVCRQASAFDPAGDPPGSVPHRWRIDVSGPTLTVTEEQVDDRWMDFPRIDLRQTGRPHDRAWYVDFTDTEDEGLLFRGITGARDGRIVDRWEPTEVEHAGEVTFVDDGEDGWLLSFVYDRSTETSDLAVFRPDDLAAGPVARVVLPRRVPFGFHGTWLPDPV